MPRSLPLILALALLVSAPARPAAADDDDAGGVGKPAPAWSDLPDERGARHSLGQHEGQVVVLVVWSSRCPHSRRYAQRLRELASRYARGGERGPRGEDERPRVAFFGLAPNAYETLETLKAGREAAKLPFPLLLDPKGAVTQRLKVATTPTVLVIDGKGVLRYRGAIDDDPQGKKERPVPHVRLAVDALLDGKQPPQTKTGGPGFRIQWTGAPAARREERPA